MRTSIPLRVASVLAAVQGAAHGVLFSRYRPVHGPAEIAVVDAMRQYAFQFGGVARSYWDFYFGYAMFNVFACAIEAVVLWELASFAQTSASLVRRLAVVFVFFNLGHAALAARYFIRAPIAFDLVMAGLLVIAIWRRPVPIADNASPVSSSP